MHPSDSLTQLNIEKIAIDWLNVQLTSNLIMKTRIEMNDSGVDVELDGYDPIKHIICEVYCGIDEIKAGQVKKVNSDAFKMILFEKVKYKDEYCRKILLFIDEAVRCNFQSNSWYSFAFSEFGIETMVAKIPEEKLNILRATKKMQCR
jgi:hypothetical protein